ncbi:DUF4136 domain-containing protein [Paraburkholderia panacisoli]|uniref:DUF4136 domain-containing protein n=1 Tax=Paraburkholderia panacisoli TaxID=2603818 RepID=A0A5B0GQH3_9BURK|nr:DUF4136 domain-containing protein [Paraburkholderia panacisoli]KAA1004840.1 DUF4136 domain-containing protein [Paraburkholderia panacisoli]
MAKVTLMCAALAAASLTGCAGLNADVHTANPPAALQGEPTYPIARLPSQDASADHPQFEALLREELARRGFVEAAGKPAHYLLSIAYDTRPRAIGIGVGAGDCAPSDCPKPAVLFSLFGGRAYQHSLTLRFFERTSGDERYKVSAVIADRDADPTHAMPVLVKSALAKFPFDAPPDWRVKLQQDKASSVPTVISVKPQQP